MDTPPFKLATPTANDFPRLVEIWEASVRATHHFLNEDDILFFKSFIQDNEVFKQVAMVCVQDADNAILGFAGVTGDNLEMLFIHPQYRGKGLGKALLQHTIDMLGIRKVDVNEQNEQAVAFYEHLGFTTMSRSPLDGTGKPFPILHMSLNITSEP